MDLGEELMVAGIGCRTGVSGEQVEAAIAAALAALHGAAARESAAAVLELGAAARESAVREAPRHVHLTAIAIPAAKATEPGIQAAAAARGLPLLAISQPDLEAANPSTVTRSAHSMAAMNVHSVAEAAALAGAEMLGKSAALAQPRVIVGPVTCALADTTPP